MRRALACGAAAVAGMALCVSAAQALPAWQAPTKVASPDAGVAGLRLEVLDGQRSVLVWKECIGASGCALKLSTRVGGSSFAPALTLSKAPTSSFEAAMARFGDGIALAWFERQPGTGTCSLVTADWSPAGVTEARTIATQEGSCYDLQSPVMSGNDRDSLALAWADRKAASGADGSVWLSQRHGGSGFAPPQRLTEAASGGVTAAVSVNGRSLVAWPELGDIRVAYFDAAGAGQGSAVIEGVRRFGGRVGRLHALWLGDGRQLIAWTGVAGEIHFSWHWTFAVGSVASGFPGPAPTMSGILWEVVPLSEGGFLSAWHDDPGSFEIAHRPRFARANAEGTIVSDIPAIGETEFSLRSGIAPTPRGPYLYWGLTLDRRRAQLIGSSYRTDPARWVRRRISPPVPDMGVEFDVDAAPDGYMGAAWASTTPESSTVFFAEGPDDIERPRLAAVRIHPTRILERRSRRLRVSFSLSERADVVVELIRRRSGRRVAHRRRRMAAGARRFAFDRGRIAKLPPGRYAVRLRATDLAGYSVTARRSLVIEPRRDR